MIPKKQRYVSTIFILVIFSLLAASPLFAGFGGHNMKGDFGLLSASQPPPGFYAMAPMYYRYEADNLRDSDGDKISIDPQERGTLDANAYIFGLIWVSEFEIFGANYSFQIFPAFTDNAMEAPILGLNESVSTGFADLYFQPINLGWHTNRADFLTGLGIYAPTGEYEQDGSDNTGLGMWSLEFFAGATLYFDEAKSWHISTNAYYETHSEKEDSDITVGDILTLEGGLGKSFMDGAVSVGAAYYAQWKLEEDDIPNLDLLPSDRNVGKHNVYGIGPEISLPLATSKKLYGFLNARYFWEFDAKSTFEGESLVVTLTFPIPSVPLQ
ncbi:MAG: SphA family protein [Desulfocapsaceae bacterium]